MSGSLVSSKSSVLSSQSSSRNSFCDMPACERMVWRVFGASILPEWTGTVTTFHSLDDEDNGGFP